MLNKTILLLLLCILRAEYICDVQHCVVSRMEELDLRSSSGVAKFLGAWVSVLGAFTVTLYKGQKILSASPLSGIPHQILHSQQPNWVLAGLLLSMAFLSFAVMGIFQVN